MPFYYYYYYTLDQRRRLFALLATVIISFFPVCKALVAYDGGRSTVALAQPRTFLLRSSSGSSFERRIRTRATNIPSSCNYIRCYARRRRRRNRNYNDYYEDDDDDDDYHVIDDDEEYNSFYDYVRDYKDDIDYNRRDPYYDYKNEDRDDRRGRGRGPNSRRSSSWGGARSAARQQQQQDATFRERTRLVDDLGEVTMGRQDSGLNIPSAFGRRDGWRLPESLSKSLLAGVFVLGIGLGVTIDSAINTDPKDLASRDAIDDAAPNPVLCAKYGASAMAFDQRVFVSFNPFNVYVAQADVKPACVLRDANVVPILRERNLINDNEVRSCKQNMNTWAFVGNLEDVPQLSCVYKSEDAQNEFLSNPKYGIGEDYLDDDREEVEKVLRSQKNSYSKMVKGGSLTEAQKQFIQKDTALRGL